MADLPTIHQKIVVDVIADKNADASIGKTTEAIKAQDTATKHHHETREEFIARGKAMLEQQYQESAAGKAAARAHAEVTKEIQKHTQSHFGLRQALKSNTAEHKKLTKEVKDLKKSFGEAGQVAKLFATFVGLIKFPAIVAGAGLATSAISALGSAIIGLVAALGPMLNLVGLLPAALAGAAGGLGALLIGGKGAFSAITAGFAAKAPGASTRDPVADARKLEDAVLGVARAQETLSDSQRDVQRAQEDLNKAWLDARNNLRDLREEQTRGTNSVARAEISLARAQQHNAEIQASDAATALDKKEALLDVSDAELDLLDAQEKRTQNARDLAEADAKGVAGSNDVVDATERLSDAQQTVIDNQLALKRAIEDQAKGLKETGGAADKFRESMKELGPESRKFVNTIVGSAGLFKQIKRDVGEALFAPINEGITAALGNAPAFKSFLVDSARGVGAIGKALAASFGEKGFGDDLKTLGAGNKGIFESLANGAKSLLKVFTDLAVVGQPFVKEIVDLAVNGLGKFSDKITALRNNGGLARSFREGLDVAKEFSRIIRDASVGLGGMLRAAKPLGDFLLNSLGKGAKNFRDFTQSFSGQTQMQLFFANMKPVLVEFGKLLRSISGEFFDLSSQNAGLLADVFARLRVEALPVIRQLFDSVGPQFVNRLIDLVVAFGKFSAALFGDSGAMQIFLKTLTGIFDVITGLLTHIPGLKSLFIILITIGTAFRALNIAASITGLKGFIKLLSNDTLKKFLFGSKAEKEATVGLFARIGAAATEAGGGIGGLTAALGPYLIAAVAAAAVAATIVIAWKEWHRRGNELKATIKDVTNNLEDNTKSVHDAVKAAADKRIADKHQEDDLKRIGITTEDITDAALRHGDAIVALRKKVVDSGELGFTFRGDTSDTSDAGVARRAAAVEAARQTFIRTGKVADDVTLSNQGLADSIDDIAKASDKAAQGQIDLGRASGDITAAQEGQAILWDITNQGVLEFLRNGRRAALELDHIRGAQEKANAAAEDAIAIQKRRDDQARGITGVAGNRITRDQAQRDAGQAAINVQAAEKKLADLRAAGKGNTKEAADAQNELNTARQDANTAALAYADSNLRLAESEAELQGKQLTTNQVIAAQEEALKGVAAFVSPNSAFRGDLTSLLAQFDSLFGEDRSMTVNVHMSPADLTEFTQGVRDAIGRAVTGGVVAAAAGVGLGGAKINPAATAVITATPHRSTGGTRQLAGGGVVPTGSGFMTTGPLAIVGEGKAQFPEFVIPTDPDHRKNAYRLMVDLLRHIGAPKFAGGGVLSGGGFDFSGLGDVVLKERVHQVEAARANQASARLALAKMKWDTGVHTPELAGLLANYGHLNQVSQFALAASDASARTVTSGDTFGDNIGTSIGNNWTFEEGAIQVKDWEAAKEQLQRERRLQNLTRARGARSLR